MDMEKFWTDLSKLLIDPLNIALFRVVMEECGALASEPTDVTYEEIDCLGSARPAIWCKPQSSSSSKVILYLHGGAFVAGSARSHRKLAAHLAQQAGTYALVLDYRQTPEHQFPAQIEDTVAAYRWLIEERGCSAKNIALAGDSAGGNLTISVSLALIQKNLPVPAAIAAFSAWLDMRISGESYQNNMEKDALVQPGALEGAIVNYLGNAARDDPLVDLLRTDLSGLPPMYLATGTADVLESDIVTLAKNASSVGIEVQLERPANMQHIWVMLAGNDAEADRYVAQAAAFISGKMEA